MYAVIDIETTGGSPEREKITEIALYLTDGTQVVNEWSTLVNPEKRISSRITQLTGITNEMVEGAPCFYEIAKELIGLTDKATFVAHNAWFDYNFIRSEFRQLGYTYKRDVLCTLQLSRKLIPGLCSYSLGNLCDELGIPIRNRHRAAGDALATVLLFHHLRQLDYLQHGKVLLTKIPALAKLHPDLDTEKIKSLPEDPGVYYFYDKTGTIIYIGKSKNLHQRVMTHFGNGHSGKALRMREQVADIGFELTGSELIALLLESAEIKKHMPVYNRSQRRNSSGYGIFRYFDEHGYLRFSLGRNEQDDIPLLSFTSKDAASGKLGALLEKYHLCQKLCGLYDSNGPCFQHQIGICSGACVGKETPTAYNLRATKALREFELDQENFFILDRGREPGELSVVKVEHGHLVGYGYIPEDEQGFGTDLLHDCIRPLPYNREMRSILKTWLRNNTRTKIITF
ncbi:MAG: GIY-YIG nuclease family protein [Chlorobi bacterium]|nr:GIY-YIG nuclease family protein [Chlorobiota bacterium]